MGIQIDIDTHYRNFKHGMIFLPQMKKVLPFGLTASVAAIVLGAVFAIKDGKFGYYLSIEHPWTADDGHAISRKSWFVPGLQNLGNNCFLNVILQALASCSSFQRFIEQIFEEYDFSGHEGNEKNLPLSCALASLLEKLCTTQQQRSSLNPRNVMVAMEHYVPSFSLTQQQDAEESLFYLVSCLRKELSECYIPNYSSLADVPALHNARIVTRRREIKVSEQQRWSRSFQGPFDGLLSSILHCRSCGFQISLEFQPFQSLHVSPMLMDGGFRVAGCSVEDCLKHFFGSERLENYFCNHCWHIAAMRYLSLSREYETDIQMLERCSEDDSCQCKKLACVKSLPWSNRFSRCFKQLSIARSPQILCVHLQRASVNNFGEAHKLLGHISFPLILDLSPFIMSRLVVENLEKKSQSRLTRLQNKLPISHADNLNLHLHTFPRDFNGKIPKDTSLEVDITECNVPALKTQLVDNDYSNSERTSAEVKRSSDKLLKTDGPSTSSSDHKGHKYRLVSVVEHFGNSGGGHYTVYRRVRAKTSDEEEDPVVLLEPAHAQWFRISDSDVERVSEKDALDAEASLLFYEKLI